MRINKNAKVSKSSLHEYLNEFGGGSPKRKRVGNIEDAQQAYFSTLDKTPSQRRDGRGISIKKIQKL